MYMPGIDEFDGTYHARQIDPERFDKPSFKTITITKGIKAVIGKFKEDPKGSTHVQTYIFDKKRFDTKDRVRKWLKENGAKAEAVEVPLQDAKLEYIGPDRDYPHAKIWRVKALTVRTSNNGRTYAKEELEEAAFTLSYRPLDIDHWSTRKNFTEVLPYPENSTGMMAFKPDENAIVGTIRVTDTEVNAKIESGKINKVSVSQVSNEMCADPTCGTKLQHGIAFTRLGLLEDLPAGDSNTSITKMEGLIAIADLICVSNNSLDTPEGNTAQMSEKEEETANTSTDASQPKTPNTKNETEEEVKRLLDMKQDIHWKEMWIAMQEIVKEHPKWTYEEIRDAALKNYTIFPKFVIYRYLL